MADTTFVDQTTVIPTEWANDVNDVVHTALGAVAGAGTITKVQFPATQVPSADVNALDDYEEGTFVPTVVGSATGGSQTYSVQVGRYTKIGRFVFVSGTVTITAKGGTMAGEIDIGGLPFAATSVSNLFHPMAIGAYTGVNLSSGYTQVGLRVTSNTAFARLVECGDNVAAQDIVVAGITDAFSISFGGGYSV